MFKSLRIRLIVAGIVSSLLMLVVAWFGRQIFDEVVRNNREISVDYRQMDQSINELKSAMLDVESNLYLYILTLEDEQKQRIQAHVVSMQKRVRDFLGDIPVKQRLLINDDARDFAKTFSQIAKVINKLLTMTPMERYPGMNLIANQLSPNNEHFLVEIQEAQLDTEDMIAEQRPEQKKVKQLLQQLRYIWGQMIGATRTLIAARSGVYGTPINSMEDAISNLDTYSTVVVQLLEQLKTLDKQSKLSERQSQALEQISALMGFRVMAINQLEMILRSEDWRHDIPLILGRLNPLFAKAQSDLNAMKHELERMTAVNLKDSGKLTQMLSVFLWGSSLILILLSLGLYLVFEFWMRRPLVDVARAMDEVGRGRLRVKVLRVGVEEIDVLVHAFHLMQAQIHNRQQRIQSILDNAGEGIITIDDHGIVESYNTEAENMFGYSEKEVVGQNVSMLMPEPDKSSHDLYLSNYRKAGGSSGVVLGVAREVQGQRKSGSIFPIELTTSVIFLEGKRKFIGVLKDITLSKQDQENLRAAKENAERANREIASKNKALLQSMERLKDAQQQLVESEKMASLGALVAGIAHEINTPIGVGVTAASHLQSELRSLQKLISGGQLTRSALEGFCQDTEEVANILENNLNRAAELVKSFKQVAVDQVSREKRMFNLSEYIDEILLNLRPRLKRTHHQINVDCDQNIQVDSFPGAYSQIFTNLIINSLVHGYEEGQWGEIKIAVVQAGEQLEINYQDDGRGMQADVVRQVFEPFFTTRRGEGGSGLGMHIVYNLVTQTLRGKIQCFSEPGKGTRFFLQLPLRINANSASS